MNTHSTHTSIKHAAYIALSIFLTCQPPVKAQYLSDAEKRTNAENERKALKQSKIDAIVGKTFWYRPGTSDVFKIEFYESAEPVRVGQNTLDMIEFKEKFYLTKETCFSILEADFKKIKLEFEDGKLAYLKPNILAETGDYPLIDNLYRGRHPLSYKSTIDPDGSPNLGALDAIKGKKFWYLPIANAKEKLNFLGGVNSDTPFTIESYTVNSNAVTIQVKFEDNTKGAIGFDLERLKICGNALPFVYVNKAKQVPSREYLYLGPPSDVIAAEEADLAAKTAAATEARNRAKRDSIALLSKELKVAPRIFEVRGVNLGGDHLQDLTESKSLAPGRGRQIDGFPDTREEISADGGSLFFYRDILFMAVYDDIQDTLEIRATMNQLEAKFKSKFISIPQQKSRDGNIETTTGGFRMNIGNYGTAEVKLSSTRPIDRRTCIDDIARDMRQRINLGLRNYSSLTDRVESECKESLNPKQLIFINKQIEGIVNSRARAEQEINARQAVEEKIKAANNKAKKF